MLLLASVVGSWVSIRAKSGDVSSYWLFLASFISTIAWIRLIKSGMKLTLAAVLFDVGAAAAYLAVMVIMGERMTVAQGLGALLTMAGIALMAS